MICSSARLRVVCQLILLQQRGCLEDASLNEIAKESGISRQMLASIVEEFQIRGLVKVRVYDGDLRSKRIELRQMFWVELRRELGPLFNEQLTQNLRF